MKVGRNDPCPCGSGKKYKRCCYSKQKLPTVTSIPPEVIRKFQKIQENENRRRKRYGETRPIIHTDFKGYKFVVVGSELHYGKNWKTFPDFLLSYIATSLGGDWGNSELKKPLEDRHQIMKWYDAMRRFQRKQKPNKDGVYEVVPNGAFAAYILLAYDLYVLKDNLSLQGEIIRRLKIPDQFQGARHELFATATCIRAGFTIEFEDEKDGSKKHPEFIAIHKRTGQKIAVEAKSKHRPGIIGYKGTRQSDNKVKLEVTTLINKALQKSKGLPLAVFVDTNLPPNVAKRIYKGPQPSDEFKDVLDRVQQAKDGKDFFNLIVFTNYPHYYGQDDEDDPQRHVTSVFSQKPIVASIHHQSIIDLHAATGQYGNVPNEFPSDFNNGDL